MKNQHLKKNKIDKPKCACGVFGIYGHKEASFLTYLGLHALQHRGQESAGIVSIDRENSSGSQFYIYKEHGLVTDVFKNDEILSSTLKGSYAVGHNRYSTRGSSTKRYNIQPYLVHYHKGNIASAHNGNLTNAEVLREKLEKEGTIFQTTTDSEIVLHLIAKSKEEELVAKILEAVNIIKGAYSFVFLTEKKLIGVRDPNGFKPLAIGTFEGSYIFASETCALDIIGAKYVRDVEPGEVVVIDDDVIQTGELKSYRLNDKVEKYHHCIFEYIYFARPDSFIFGDSVDKVRRKLGKALAQEHPVYPDEGEKVIVISVPDSSNTATIGYADMSKKMGINTKLEIGLIRNHYVGRTFINPKQNGRETAVRQKFNVVRGVLKDRKVVIIDDSIVRGTTSKKLISLIREAGPKEIHFRVSSPPIISPCFYGMDFPSKKELIAVKCGENIDKIKEYLGVDSLEYLSKEKLLESVPYGEKTGYCTACFSGVYPVPVDMKSEKEIFDTNE
jgi:amidophosphoribosyltransferase